VALYLSAGEDADARRVAAGLLRPAALSPLESAQSVSEKFGVVPN
jgi:hypothetical protein